MNTSFIEQFKVEIPLFQDASLEGSSKSQAAQDSINFFLGPNRKIESLSFKETDIPIPKNDTHESKVTVNGVEFHIVNFNHHPMNIYSRFEKTDSSLLHENQDKLIIVVQASKEKVGLVVPRVMNIGEISARLDISSNKENGIFSIKLYRIYKNNTKEVEVKTPGEGAKILFATQILGHVKCACDMQEYAYENDTLDQWRYALPPTERANKDLAAASKKGVPTDEVTRPWSYGLESEAFPSDFTKPESFPTVLGFLAANSRLCRETADGDYKIISTNFKQEGYILKLINPNVTLTGIYFAFLSGTPRDRMKLHTDLPKFQRMLDRVQKSLDNAPTVLQNLAGKEIPAADWWRLCYEKTTGLDFLLYRTLSYDKALPGKHNDTSIIQVPHPTPEIKLTRDASRKHIESIIEKNITEKDKILLLAGESNDGFLRKRIEETINFAKDNQENTIIIMPFKLDDPRIADIDLPPNAYPIGYRPDWVDIIPGSDATFLRGSWGEILDVIAAGNVPIITSPGVVPNLEKAKKREKDEQIGKVQFLTEVSGERANNLSLFLRELQHQGVRTETLAGLLSDTADDSAPGETANAIKFALQEVVAKEIKSALSSINRNGIKYIVELHERLAKNEEIFSEKDIKDIHKEIWGEVIS